MVTLIPLPIDQATVKVANNPLFSIGQLVKIFEHGEHSKTYKVYAIGVNSLEQDENYGFWEAGYIYALCNHDSKIPTANIRWEYEQDLVRADFWEQSEF